MGYRIDPRSINFSKLMNSSFWKNSGTFITCTRDLFWQIKSVDHSPIPCPVTLRVLAFVTRRLGPVVFTTRRPRRGVWGLVTSERRSSARATSKVVIVITNFVFPSLMPLGGSWRCCGGRGDASTRRARRNWMAC